VVVIELEGRVSYTWVADTIEERPDIDAVQQAFAAVGDAELAETQYSEACARYSESHDAFRGDERAPEPELVLASGEFETAAEALGPARDGFRRSARFSKNEAVTPSLERGLRVAEELGRAVDLLGDAASAHASGDGQRREALREEAEDIIERPRELGPPPDPEDLPDDLGDETTTGEGLSVLDAVSGRSEGDVPVAATDPGLAVEDQSSRSDDDTESDGDIDDEELEALTAERETQELSNGDGGSDPTAGGSLLPAGPDSGLTNRFVTLDALLAVHVRPQRLRHGDRPVGVLVVLKNSDHHAGECQTRGVQRVEVLGGFVALGTVTQTDASCLERLEVRGA
jgi:hypothetical protein